MRYRNPHIKNIYKTPWDFFKWRVGLFKDKRAVSAAPEGFKFPNPVAPVVEGKPKVTWINHSTFLVELGAVRVLTDPIWGERCAPFEWIGPKRHHEPPVPLSKLPHIDIVLISHNHYDHLDYKTIMALHKKFPRLKWVVAQGLSGWFTKRGIGNVVELPWWTSTTFKMKRDQITITAVPAQHFSGRSLFDRDTSHWCGFVAESEMFQKRFYFVGDTGYNAHDFKEIGKKFGEVDLALIPIGTYRPDTFMRPVHICPAKAVSIHKEVHSKLSIGMHYKTFRLSEEPMQNPPYDLFLALEKGKVDPQFFRVIEPGQTLNW